MFKTIQTIYRLPQEFAPLFYAWILYNLAFIFNKTFSRKVLRAVLKLSWNWSCSFMGWRHWRGHIDNWLSLILFQFTNIVSIHNQSIKPAVVAWSVERLLHKKCHLPTVVLILLGTYKYDGTIMDLLMLIRYIPMVHIVLPAKPSWDGYVNQTFQGSLINPIYLEPRTWPLFDSRLILK